MKKRVDFKLEELDLQALSKKELKQVRDLFSNDTLNDGDGKDEIITFLNLMRS